MNYYQEYLEWEIIDTDKIITQLTFKHGVYNLSKDCVIKFSRSNQYGFVATISGLINNKSDLEVNQESIAGGFVTPETIIGYSADGEYKYTFTDAFLGAKSFWYRSVMNLEKQFEAELIFQKVEKVPVELEAEAAFVHEWYLTGKIDVAFPRRTRRDAEVFMRRNREEIDQNIARRMPSMASSDDHMQVRYLDTGFVVAKVPDQFGPGWATKICIEYRAAFGRIPDVEEREAIAELVGFIMGSQLIKVGQTFYDRSHIIIRQEFDSPADENVVNRCDKLAVPPVVVNNYRDAKQIEVLLAQLLPRFLAQRGTLQLKDALWKYWIARHAPIGTNLPVLSSAVETLADQVLRAAPEVKPYYIAFKEFGGMIAEELKVIYEKLGEHPYRDRILNKLRGASQRGGNEKLQMMFEILELEVGEVELRAIRARNKMAHSSMGNASEGEVREIYKLSLAYETLFNRVFLRVLGYEGRYVDYYSVGHVERGIEEVIG